MRTRFGSLVTERIVTQLCFTCRYMTRAYGDAAQAHIKLALRARSLPYTVYDGAVTPIWISRERFAS